ncbi:MAG: hypothetical protein ACRBI6_08870 [Acidimicrobiales bacterium]
MGEPVTVIEKPSTNPGIVRFETNRTFTGMGHERYELGQEITGDRPVDDIGRVLLETGHAQSVHVYAQTITVHMAPGASTAELKEALESVALHYKPGVAVPTEADFA